MFVSRIASLDKKVLERFKILCESKINTAQNIVIFPTEHHIS